MTRRARVRHAVSEPVGAPAGPALTSVLKRAFVCALAALTPGLAPAPSLAQHVSQRGFGEVRAAAFPLDTPTDDTAVVTEYLLRYEASTRPWPWLRVTAAADVRADSNGWTTMAWEPSLDDRSDRRPRLAVRRLDASVTRGALTIDIGKQFVRWGKTDILNPTDRFAPRDYLNVFDTDLLAVTGVRAILERGSDTLDVVWVPALTPSRLPLPGRRWAPQADVPAGVTVVDAGRSLPRGGQAGARWSHVGTGVEWSVSGYRGFQHLPTLETIVDPTAWPPTINAALTFPKIWMVGSDAAIPLSALTLKGEAACFGGGRRADPYCQFVLQAERQAGEWSLVAGYAGEVARGRREPDTFSPERGLAQTFMGKAGYTIDANRSLAVEGATRQSLDGSWVRAEYSQASGRHVRVTLSGSWIRGDPGNFFGRYRRNSHIATTVRYSF